MSKFLKELGQKTVVAQEIDRWLKTADLTQVVYKYKEKESDDAFHPSSAYECARTRYAAIKGHTVRKPLDPSSIKTFQVGHFWHSLIQHAVVDMGFSTEGDIEKEHRRYYPGWWARGFIDVAHCNTPSGDYLVDIKTMNGISFRQPNMQPALWNKYFYQVQLYMDWEDQDQAVLLCVNKDHPHDFKEYVFDRDPALVSSIYDRWSLITACIEEDTIPPCDCEAMGKNPENCPTKGTYV